MHPHCLLLVIATSNQREVYFDSDDDLQYWRCQILTAQGCKENRLEQYKFERVLGEGSFGKVYLAQHLNTQVRVAVKIISKEKIADVFKKNKENFFEIELMEEVSGCSNILSLIESFEDANNFYVVTRCMNCGSLMDYIMKQSNSPLPENQARDIIQQIATGLSGLHQRNIVHRDIKIENILVDTSVKG